MRWLALMILITALIGGCTQTQQKTMRQDPLIGTIVSSQTGKQVSYDLLLKKALAAEVVYLGEKHDNAEHHAHQRRLIKDLIQQGTSPILGFEFFSMEQTGALMRYVTQAGSPHGDTHDHIAEQRLRRDLGWLSRSDESWEFYFSFIRLARENKLIVFGADLPREIVRRITRNGVDSLTAVELSLLRSTDLRNEAYRELMYDAFKAAHCGFAHQEMQEKMYQAWLQRNDTMAFSLVQMHRQYPDRPIVMILGNGHVEYNMAVYERATFLQPSLNQLNIGLQEISIHPAPLTDYLQTVTRKGREFPPPHDFLWFTQRSSYENPCETFHNQLKQLKKRQE